VVCEVCGYENQLAARECEKCDVPLPGGASAEAAKRAGAAVLGSTLFRPQDNEGRRPSLRLSASLRLLILIAVLLLLVGIWGWQQYKSHRASAASPMSTILVSQPAPAASQ
jgi:hypothetical protein